MSPPPLIHYEYEMGSISTSMLSLGLSWVNTEYLVVEIQVNLSWSLSSSTTSVCSVTRAAIEYHIEGVTRLASYVRLNGIGNETGSGPTNTTCSARVVEGASIKETSSNWTVIRLMGPILEDKPEEGRI